MIFVLTSTFLPGKPHRIQTFALGRQKTHCYAHCNAITAMCYESTTKILNEGSHWALREAVADKSILIQPMIIEARISTNFFCTKSFKHPLGHGHPRQNHGRPNQTSVFRDPAVEAKLFDLQAFGREGLDVRGKIWPKRFVLLFASLDKPSKPPDPPQASVEKMTMPADSNALQFGIHPGTQNMDQMHPCACSSACHLKVNAIFQLTPFTARERTVTFPRKVRFCSMQAAHAEGGVTELPNLDGRSSPPNTHRHLSCSDRLVEAHGRTRARLQPIGVVSRGILGKHPPFFAGSQRNLAGMAHKLKSRMVHRLAKKT